MLLAALDSLVQQWAMTGSESPRGKSGNTKVNVSSIRREEKQKDEDRFRKTPEERGILTTLRGRKVENC